VRLHGTTVSLSAPAGATYYHWMLDVLPRIALLRSVGFDWREADRIVVASFRRPFQRETFERLGVPLDKVVEAGSFRHAVCERLVLPSYPGISGFPPSWACRFLRESFLNETPEPARRLYVSRARSRGRGIANEEQVRAAAEAAGFETVFPEEMPVRAQASLFAAARAVVAPHGSGLTNLVFCQPGTSVLELFPPGFRASHYWVLSRQAGLVHRALMGGRGPGTGPVADFRVDPAAFEAALATLERTAA
jgi:capsular polysaccharide biosynthesis protein